MGWDASALILAQLFASEGLIARHREGKHFNDGFIEGYKTAIEERVVDQYWGSDESDKLGDVLFHEVKNGQQTETLIYEIQEAIEAALLDTDLNESERAGKIEMCRSQLVKILKTFRDTTSRKSPIKELDELIKRLEKHELS